MSRWRWQFGTSSSVREEKAELKRKRNKPKRKKRQRPIVTEDQEIVADSHRGKIGALEQILSDNQTNLKIKTTQLTEAVEALQLSGDVFTKKQTGGQSFLVLELGTKFPCSSLLVLLF